MSLFVNMLKERKYDNSHESEEKHYLTIIVHLASYIKERTLGIKETLNIIRF